MSEPTQSSKLNAAADALARVVAELISPSADPQLAHAFREALGTLLAETLGGATVMAAGAVVALNAKVDRIAESRGARLLDIQRELDRLAERVHTIEDAFLDDGQIGQLAATMYTLAGEIELLKARSVGDDSAE